MKPDRCAFETAFEFTNGKEVAIGLTVRAYIAAKALQGIVANPMHKKSIPEDMTVAEVFAQASVKLADALIAELSK